MIRGGLFRDKNQLEAAVSAFELALRYDRGNPEILIRLGDAQVLLQNWSDAAVTFEEIIRQNPKNGPAFLGLALARIQLDALDAAEDALERAKEIGVVRSNDLVELQKLLKRRRQQERTPAQHRDLLKDESRQVCGTAAVGCVFGASIEVRHPCQNSRWSRP